MNQTQTSTKRRLFKKSKPKKDEIKKNSTKKKKFSAKPLVKETKEKVVVSNQEKEWEFPKIPRFIPELPSIPLEKLHLPTFKAYGKSLKKYSQTKLLFAGVLLLFALLLSGFTVMSFYHAYTAWSKEMAKRQQLYTEMQMWDNITKTYPAYPDAYFKGAVIAYQLGDQGKVVYFLNKLYLLDPNFPLIAPLKKLETVQQLGEK